MERLSAFSKPEWSARDQVHKDPPLYHVSAYVTGGLHAVFKHIRAGTQVSEHTGKHKQRDQFRPVDGQILARRYRLTDKLSTQGQFAVILGAKDLCCDERPVIIKVMHRSFYAIGLQERHCLWRLAVADPCNFSHTVHLLNTFQFDGHFCLVFEFLHPTPITGVFEEYNLPNYQLIKKIRKVAFQLLQVLGFLQQQNTIHADIKPENILLQDVHDVGSLKVIDFGNAIHHIHKEVSLYYCDFELQTLQYRAPEVIFGIPFGTEVDMWSLGCVLAELYLGESLFGGTTKDELLQSMTKLLGRFPVKVFHRGKFFENYQSVTSKIPQPDTTICLMQRLRDSRNYAFANFLAELLRYNPDERLTPVQALHHSFLAPEFSLGYFIPSAHTLPNCIDINPRSYTLGPKISAELKRQNPSTFDLLKMGTQCSELDKVPCNKIAKVCPFEPNAPKVQIPEVIGSNSQLSPPHSSISAQNLVTVEMTGNNTTSGDILQADKQNTPAGLHTLGSTAENDTKVNNTFESSECTKRKMANSDSNISLNSVKLQNIMAMITVEQERVEDLMDVQEKRNRTCNDSLKRTHMKVSASSHTSKRRRKKPDVDSSNFLCEYASSSSDSDLDECCIVDVTDVEKKINSDCISHTLTQDVRIKPVLSKCRKELTSKDENESVALNFVAEVFLSQSIKSLSQDNHSTKIKISKANSNQLKSGLDYVHEISNEVKNANDFKCSNLQNSDRKRSLLHARPKKPVKRRLLFSKAFPVAKPDHQVSTVKGLKLWNDKYHSTKRKMMKTRNNRTSVVTNVKAAVSREAGDDPFEFKMTPLKSPETKQKAATTERKKSTRSRKKSQNTLSKNSRKAKPPPAVKDKESRGESIGSNITSVENLDCVFRKYSKLKDISPIKGTPVCNMKAISQISSTPVEVCTPRAKAKRQSLLSESSVEPADSPCKRKCVQRLHTRDMCLDGTGKQPEPQSRKSSAANAYRPRTVPDSTVQCERLHVSEIAAVSVGRETRKTSPYHISSVHRNLKTVNKKSVVDNEESINSTLTTARSSLRKVQSHYSAARAGQAHALQLEKIGVVESVKKLTGRHTMTSRDSEEIIGQADSTAGDKTTTVPDDDDIILLDI